jgi:hypothetical protein
MRGVTMPRILRPIAASIVDFKKRKGSEMKIDNTRFSQSTRHHWRGASRDLLLLALSILKTGKRNSQKREFLFFLRIDKASSKRSREAPRQWCRVGCEKRVLSIFISLPSLF